MSGKARGVVTAAVTGIDLHTIGEQTMALFGDTSGNLTAQQKAKSHLLAGDAWASNDLYGDAYKMSGSSWGGNDTLIGGSGSDNLCGEADEMYGNSKGGNDSLRGGGGDIDFLFGEAFLMSDGSQGGNDTLTAQAIESYLFGDAQLMQGSSRGGNDTLTSGGALNYLFGDALNMDENTRGGNDMLEASRSAALYGDAFSMSGQSQGGNDRLSGGDASDSFMVGDGRFAGSIQVRGGSDILSSGSGNDQMWGDFVEWAVGTPAAAFGADIFCFGLDNGTDTIHDYQQGKDRIDLSGKGITDLLGFTMTIEGANLILGFGDASADGQITVIGVGQLTDADFIFAPL